MSENRPDFGASKRALKQYGPWSLLIGILLLLLFLGTAPPHTTMEDAAEFTLMAHFLGLPHPPGYPTFVLVGHAFSWIDFLSPAVRIALLSMLAIIGSGFFVGLITLYLGGGLFAACFSFILFGLSTVAWGQALVVEVYALHSLFMVALLFLALVIRNRPTTRLTVTWFFLLGLSLTNQWPLTILGLPAFVLLFWLPRRELGPALKWAVPAFLLGLSPYLWLFTIDRQDFSFLGPIDSVSGFFDYISRREYRDRPLPFRVAWKEGLFYLRDFGRLLVSDLYGIGALLAALGAYSFILNKRGLILAALLLALLSSNVLLLPVWRPEHNIYFRDIFVALQVFSFAVWTLFIGMGLDLAFRFLQGKKLGKTLIALTALASAAIAWQHGKTLTLHRDDFAGLYAQLILSSLPPNSVLITCDDADTGALAYQHHLLGQLSDVELVSQMGAFFPTKIFNRETDRPDGPMNGKIRDFIDAKLQSGKRVFTISEIYSFEEQNAAFPFHLIPYGWFFEVTKDPNPAPLNIEDLKSKTIAFLDAAMRYSETDQFPYMRSELIQYGCSLALAADIDHPTLHRIPACQYLLAERLIAERKDPAIVENHLRQVLQGRKDWPREENLQLALRLFEIRSVMLSQLQDKHAQTAFVNETFQILRPYVEDFPYCSNILAPRLIALGYKESITPFQACSWFRSAIPPY